MFHALGCMRSLDTGLKVVMLLWTWLCATGSVLARFCWDQAPSHALCLIGAMWLLHMARSPPTSATAAVTPQPSTKPSA
jgi:hypothetical protein